MNIIVGSKQPTPVFLGQGEVEAHCRAGADVFKFCSTNLGRDLDIILIGVGLEFTFEVVEAATTGQYCNRRLA